MNKQEQYFTSEPTTASAPVSCGFAWRGHLLSFATDTGVFSKGELDTGTRLLLDALPELSGSVLDAGCGWGPIGIAVAKHFPQTAVTMLDVNRRALALTERNAQTNGVAVRVVESDGLAAVQGERFDWVLTNPPIRAGKAVIYRMFADAAKLLNDGGSLILVIRKQQGAASCTDYLKTLFARVEVLDRSAGFRVLQAMQPIA